MFGVIKYFFKLMQFGIAMLLTVTVLMYATERYKAWRNDHDVPACVERMEYAALVLSERLAILFNGREGTVGRFVRSHRELPPFQGKAVPAASDTSCDASRYFNQLEMVEQLQSRLADTD